MAVGLVVFVAPAGPAAALPGDGYGAAVLGLPGLAHYWRFGDSPAVGSAFADSVPPGGGGWPAAAGVTRGADASPGVAGIAGGDSAVGLGSAPVVKLSTTLPAGDAALTSASLDLWLRPTSLPASGSTAVVFDTDSPFGGGLGQLIGHGFQLVLGSQGELTGQAGFGSGGQVPDRLAVVSQSRIAAGQWAHVTLTWDQSGVLSMFVDGTREAIALGPAYGLHWGHYLHTNNTGWVSIGQNADNQGSTEVFVGAVDEVAIVGGSSSGAGLDAEEVRALQVASGRPIGGVPFVDPRELLGPNGALRNQCALCPWAGDPVSTGSGNFFEPLPGLSLGARGAGLSFGVQYNSSPAPLKPVDGPVGFGWSSSLDMRLERSITGWMNVVQEGGSVVPFGPDGSGGWVAPPRYRASLVAAGGQLVFTRNHSEVFRFAVPAVPVGVPSTVGRLESMGDLFGNETVLEYGTTVGTADFGRVTLLRQGSGPGQRALDVAWSAGRIASVTDQLPAAEGGPRSLGFSYDAAGDLRDYTDAEGGHWLFTYDANHRLITMQRPGNDGSEVVENKYDGQGRVDWQDDELDRRTDFAYDTPVTGKTTVTFPTAPGAPASRRVDTFEGGFRVKSEVFDGPSTLVSSVEYEFDPVTLELDWVKDGAGKMTDHDWDPVTRTRTVTDPTDRVTRVVENVREQPVTVTTGLTTSSSAQAVVTQNSYDPVTGRLEATVVDLGGPDQATTDLVYGDAAHPEDVTKMVDARGKEWTFGYEPASGLAVWAQDPLGNRSVTSYSVAGWPLSQTSPEGVASPTAGDYMTSYVHGLADRSLTVTDPAGVATKTVRDPRGNVVEARSGTGLVDVTVSVFDAADQLVSVDAPETGPETFTYWPGGQRKTWTNPEGGVWSYRYDAAGRLEAETDPAGNETTYEIDAAGRVDWVRHPVAGATCVAATKVGCIDYSYDDAGRPTGVDYSDASTPDVTAIGYDDLGRRVAATVGAAPETWAWNRRSQLTGHLDANGRTTGYGWDLGGNVTSIIYPGSGTLTRTFDDAGRLETVRDWNNRVIEFDYDKDSNWTSTAFPGGVNTDAYGYDQAGRMTSASWAGPSGALGSETYTRSVASKGMVDATARTGVAGSGSLDATYDHKDRLDGYGTEAFDQDGADNVTVTGAGDTQVYDDHGFQLCPPGAVAAPCSQPAGTGVAADFDTRGNRVSERRPEGAARVLGYDQANRLSSVTDAPAASIPAMTSTKPVAGDFDGDGRDDAFFYKPGSGTGNEDHMFWGSGRAAFGAASDTYPVNSTYGHVVAGDFNGDGFEDLFFYQPGSASDWVWFWFGRHGGGYNAKSFGVSNTYTPLVGDFDGDSYSDIYWYGSGAASDTLWFGDDDVDAAGTSFDTGTTTVNGVYLPVTGDFDGNGADDIFWYAPGSTADAIWYFSTSVRNQWTSVSKTVSGTFTLVAGNFDGDGFSDVMFHTASSAVDNVWWGQASQAGFGPTGQSDPNLTGTFVPFAGDFDGDGKDDLFAYSASGADTMWWGTTRSGFGKTAGQIGLSAQSTMTAAYAYDSDGLRRSKTVDGQTTGFTWDTSGGLPLLLSTHKAGLDTAIIYGPGNQAVAQIADDGTPSWFHHDQLGTIRLTTNATGAETYRGSHSAYGAPVASTGTAPLLGYAGQYHDVETGYQYLRARYYDPATAQFLTVDPLTATTLEPYGYTGANPLNATDPTGLCWGPACWAEAALLGVMDMAAQASGGPSPYSEGSKNRVQDVDRMPDYYVFEFATARGELAVIVTRNGAIYGALGPGASTGGPAVRAGWLLRSECSEEDAQAFLNGFATGFGAGYKGGSVSAVNSNNGFQELSDRWAIELGIGSPGGGVSEVFGFRIKGS
jgi:RHS repeat-associated protein